MRGLDRNNEKSLEYDLKNQQWESIQAVGWIGTCPHWGRRFLQHKKGKYFEVVSCKVCGVELDRKNLSLDEFVPRWFDVSPYKRLLRQICGGAKTVSLDDATDDLFCDFLRRHGYQIVSFYLNRSGYAVDRPEIDGGGLCWYATKETKAVLMARQDAYTRRQY